MGGHVLRVTFEPCRLYGDGRVREKKWGPWPPWPPVSDAYVMYIAKYIIYVHL